MESDFFNVEKKETQDILKNLEKVSSHSKWKPYSSEVHGGCSS
jgi:hypothetical protein